MGMRDEILEQPAVAARLLETSPSLIEEIARAIQSRAIEFVLIAGRGTSDHAGVYAQYIFGARNDLPVALAAPSLFSIYGARPRLRHALVIGISQSGRSPDVVGVVEEGRRQGALTLAVTNDRSSPLGDAAEWVIDIAAGPERAIAARGDRKPGFDHAARPWYSWMSPPSRSRRRTSRGLTWIGSAAAASGGVRPRARWGRPRL